MEHLREEMLKTEELQAKEEQTLAEWQVGASHHTRQPGVGRRACRPYRPPDL